MINKPTILKYILLTVSVLAMLGTLLKAALTTTGTLSFFHSEEPLTKFQPINKPSNMEGVKTMKEKRKIGITISDIELHYQKKWLYGNGIDTTINLKYLTLVNSRSHSNVVPVKRAISPEAVNSGYDQMESLKSIPFKKLDAGFWKPFLLSRIMIKTVIYLSIMMLIFSITKTAFKTTPFTAKIRNKLYLLSGSMLLLVLNGWIFFRILSAHIVEYYNFRLGFLFYGTWFLMGILMLFIATVFDYGIRLQKEQDLTI